MCKFVIIYSALNGSFVRRKLSVDLNLAAIQRDNNIFGSLSSNQGMKGGPVQKHTLPLATDFEIKIKKDRRGCFFFFFFSLLLFTTMPGLPLTRGRLIESEGRLGTP